VDVPANGEAEGVVTFPYTDQPTKPRPKQYIAVNQGGVSLTNFPFGRPVTILLLTALTSSGAAAGNVGWAIDTTQSSVGSGNLLQSRALTSPYPGGPELGGGDYGDLGSAAGVPRMAIETGSFTSDEIAFTAAGNRLDLGATPTGDVIFATTYEAPTGTSIVPQVLKDSGNPATEGDWRTFTDGQKSTELADVSKRQTYEIRAKLLTNAATNLTPTLRRLGVEEKAITDLSDVAELRAARWAVDPVTLTGEITEGQIVALTDGERDFHAAIEALLATTDIGKILLRYYVGDRALGRSQWLHVDDFLIDDAEAMGGGLTITVLGVLSLVRAQLPKLNLSGAGVETPDTDLYNGDGWTDQDNGTSNLYTRIDEDPPDDTDYVRSATSPSTDAVVFRLSDLSDPGRDTGHFVDFRYKKDSSGGELLDLTIQLRQGYTNEGSPGTLIMTGTVTNIASEWTEQTLALTTAQAAAITNYTALALRLVANVASGSGARRVQISWLRFRITGQRETLTYTNQSGTTIYADLLDQTELPTRYRGPAVVSAELLTKTITDSDAKGELDAVARLFGHGIISSQGRVKAVDFVSPQGVAVIVPSEELEPLQITPGYRERIPEFFVPWNWDQGTERFLDEERAFHTAGLTALGRGRTDAVVRFDDESSKYLYNRSLAQTIATRQVQQLGTGLLRWRVRTSYAHPELEPGDVVAVQTDRFVAKDPNSSRALRGRLWAIGRVVEVGDPWGRELSIWVQGYADILGQAGATTVVPTVPVVCKIYRTADYTTLNVAIPFTAEASDPLGQHSTSVNTERVLVLSPAPRAFRVTANVPYQGFVATACELHVLIRHWDAAGTIKRTIARAILTAGGSTSGTLNFSGQTLDPIAAGDYFDLATAETGTCFPVTTMTIVGGDDGDVFLEVVPVF